MERTLFLVIAVIGFAVGGAMEAADVGVAGAVVMGIAGTCLAVWVVALGVHLGIKDALFEMDEDRLPGTTMKSWRGTHERD